ncbi:MAG: YitT family protein [Lachnospirales bacterium]
MKEVFKKLFWIAFGQLIASIAFTSILSANGLIANGFGGLSTVINQVTGINVQLILVCLAIPVFIWAFFFYDKKQIMYACFSFFIFTFYIGIVEKYVPVFETDMIIAAIAGGVIMGFAGGIIMKQRVSNGPEAIVALYLKKKTGITVGDFFLILNSTIICTSIVYGDLTIIAYSFISTYIQSYVTDLIIIGSKKYYNVTVMSKDFLDIAEYIQKNLERNVTLVSSFDADSTTKKMLIQTVLTQVELVTLRDKIDEIDDDAFVYANKTSSIMGKGFSLD